MIRKLSVIGVALCILFIPLVIASDTPITVHAAAGNAVTLNVLNAETLEAYTTFINTTDEYGNVAFTFSSSVTKVSFSVIVRNNGKIITNKFFANYSTGSAVYLDTIFTEPSPTPAPAAPASQLQANNTPTLTNTSIISVANTTITENVSSLNITSQTSNRSSAPNGEKNVFSSIQKGIVLSWIGYVLIGIVVGIMVAWLTRRYNQWRKGRTFSSHEEEKHTEKREVISKSDKELIEAERKIKEAQEEIDRIRNRKRKIADAESRFEEARKELERLRRNH